MKLQPLLRQTLWLLVCCGSLGLNSPAFADQGFVNWISGFRAVAVKSGVRPAAFDAAFSGIVDTDALTIEKMGKQAEFTKKIWEYLDSAVSETQVRNGQDMAGKLAQQLAAIEKRFGVDAQVVLAVWGIESRYGAKMGDHNVIHALATLAYAAPRRREFWTAELINALKIVQAGHIAPENMIGSWAGAMGHTQFMPSSWKQFAADYENDGKRDIWTSIPDALASTANYLAKNGWRKGEAWGYEVVVPKGVAALEGKDGIALSQWQAKGVRRTGGGAFPRVKDKAVLKFPGGRNGPAFLVLKNFFVIKRYNNSDFYAMAVGHLSDRIAGRGEFAAKWPRGYDPLNEAERKQVQQILTRLGFYSGEIDGAIGSGSKESIIAFQNSIAIIPDGFPSKALLAKLKAR